MTDEPSPTWLRAAAVLLAVPQVFTGAWAAITPRGWYDDFPGFGPMLVSAEPPFNAHLASDAAAGFLATGLVLLLAAWGGRAAGMRVALAGYLAFAVVHLAYHAQHSAPGFTDTENAVNLAVLVAAAALPAVLLVFARPRKEPG